MDCGSNVAAWKLQWDSYCSLSGLANQDTAQQVEALTLCFSRDTLSVVQNFGLTDKERPSEDSIVSTIKRYIVGHVNQMVERRNFCKSTEQVGKLFNDFLLSLCELVKAYNFCSDACTPKNIRDQVIEGLLDADIVEDLLQETNLTLATAVHK